MITKKYCNKIIIVLSALAVLICLGLMFFSDQLTERLGGKGIKMDYEEKLFDTSSIIDLNIKIDEDKWQDLLENAIDEAYYPCDVTVNGTTFQNVGIRTKGNMSLSSVVSDPDSDRYSLKIEFDHYNEGQTCFGLDKLILNNNYADATNMKEAIVYDMFQYIGADASLYNYAKISVNGEYWGVYLALEGVEDSFLLRNYGAGSGKLYKPESTNMGGPSGNNQTGGADLNYTDDKQKSYSVIWDGAVNESKKADYKRVITALKHISQKDDIEDYMDIDNVLKYMAVHNFVVNLDSLSGNMTHNYYLYEQAGKLNLIPWDYNLALGGFMQGGSNATETINFAIDTPFSDNITLQDRQFFAALLENEEYLAQYHNYLKQLCEGYVNGGRYEQVYARIRQQIDTLVETDPNAFYTYEAYDKAAQMLSKVILLRSESVSGQLSGSIPSTREGQKVDQSSLIDASDIHLNTMGTMNAGGKDGKMMAPDEKNKSIDSNTANEKTGEQSQENNQPQRGEQSQESDQPQRGEQPQEGDQLQKGEPPQGGQPPNDMGNRPPGQGGPQDMTAGESLVPTLIWLGISLLTGIIGLIIAKKYRRR